ncbi:E3 ubiquitin-protein ligase Jade-2-like [Boleophthalmus pectinirostris]|uniref:E3 ubiquitin-protein ligase Jade-2-like n=1 Tax=Boleophthalmus pectinirostris TaxID=150288 RepID=UPI00242CAF68|nr:E3 ubiquitin-protein ligase Jade-2-like [Boleophthalmus pectinirostris]
MPSCIVAFHVTCAFDHGLEMKTILAENDEVRFKSFCLEHSSTHGTMAGQTSAQGSHPTQSNQPVSPSGLSNPPVSAVGPSSTHQSVPGDTSTHGSSSGEAFSHGSSLGQSTTHTPPAVNGTHSDTYSCASNGLQPPSAPALLSSGGSSEPEQRVLERVDREQMEREKVSQRKQKLQQLEDEFYRLVCPEDVCQSLGLPLTQVDFIYEFWKLKRKTNFNRPLVSLNRDEVDNLAQQEQDVLYRRLKLFTHLRQDLERVRNLCYMVTRRERMKHSLCDLQEKIFDLQIQLLEEELTSEKEHKGEKKRQNGVKEKRKERGKSGGRAVQTRRKRDGSLRTDHCSKT